MKWKKENKSKLDGGEGIDDSPPGSQWDQPSSPQPLLTQPSLNGGPLDDSVAGQPPAQMSAMLGEEPPQIQLHHHHHPQLNMNHSQGYANNTNSTDLYPLSPTSPPISANYNSQPQMPNLNLTPTSHQQMASMPPLPQSPNISTTLTWTFWQCPDICLNFFGSETTRVSTHQKNRSTIR